MGSPGAQIVRVRNCPRSLGRTNAVAAWPDIHLREQGKELKTPRAANPNVTKHLKRKLQSLWPPTAQTFVLDTAATL
jgi:hypothetical protein